MIDKKILFLSKKTPFCNYAVQILQNIFDEDDIKIVQSEKLNTFVESKINLLNYDYLISFLWPEVISQNMIKRSNIASINFHPGSPHYPGIGCFNFAIYEKSDMYGVTCHYMEKKVNSGKIIATSYFKLYPNDSVLSLLLKSVIHLLYLFNIIIDYIARDQSLPLSDEKWTRNAFTRKDLNNLCKIDPKNMDLDEIKQRIKATDYPDKDGAFINIEGLLFKYIKE